MAVPDPRPRRPRESRELPNAASEPPYSFLPTSAHKPRVGGELPPVRRENARARAAGQLSGCSTNVFLLDPAPAVLSSPLCDRVFRENLLDPLERLLGRRLG